MSHVDLLSLEQWRAIQPHQFEYLPFKALDMLFKKYYEDGRAYNEKAEENGKEAKPYTVSLTVEQFSNLTLEHFQMMIDEKWWNTRYSWRDKNNKYQSAYYIGDEYFNTLSLETIDALLEYINTEYPEEQAPEEPPPEKPSIEYRFNKRKYAQIDSIIERFMERKQELTAN